MALSYWIIDLETTGFSPKTHEICQISIIRCENLHQLSKDVRVSYPHRSSQESLNIIGKTREQLLLGERKDKIVDAVENFFAQDGKSPEYRCMIGHTVSFDRRFCFALWDLMGKKFPAECWLDTKELTRKWTKTAGMQKPKLTLGASLEHLGIKPAGGMAHNAIKDTQDCYFLWKKLVDEGVDYLPLIKKVPHE